MKGKNIKKESPAREYYDTHGVLKDIVNEDIDLSLEDELREAILSGKRKRNLRNISIKIDPLYLQSIKKIATMKGIPYQTLVREWLTEKIRKELKIA
jgi:predicted DNA binding CopG/RHH family protein